MVESTERAPAVKEVHILWITAGLGCDGDSVSITAATQPSVEDVLLGAIPGLPKVHLHNPVLAYENGDDFMKFFYRAEEGKLEPFVLVVEGSIPETKILRKKATGPPRVGITVSGVGLALVPNETGQVLAQLLNPTLEFLNSLLPLIECWRPPCEEEVENMDKLVRFGKVGVHEPLAVLVEDSAARF